MKLTQHEEVRKHLETYGHITSMEAFERYGATRLSAIIYNLKKEGMNITTEQTKGTTRYGRAVTFATYVYKKQS